MATTPVGGREMVTAEELARVFGVELREDPLTRGLALTVQGKTIVVSPTTGLASIGGRVVTLSTPPVRGERGWSLPMDFVDRALSLVYQPRLDVRPATHLIVVGDVRVPRVQVRLETQPRLARVHFDVTPSTPHTIVAEPGRLVLRFEATALDLELAAAGPPDLVLALRALPNTPAVAIDQGPRYGTFRVVEGRGRADAPHHDRDPRRRDAGHRATRADDPGTPRRASRGRPAHRPPRRRPCSGPKRRPSTPSSSIPDTAATSTSRACGGPAPAAPPGPSRSTSR